MQNLPNTMKYPILLYISFLLLTGIGPATFAQPPSDMTASLKSYVSEKYPQHTFDEFLYVSVDSQRMYLISDWKIKESYVISTGKNGTGNLSGSNKTPLGLHKIAAKYGDKLKPGAILKSRQFTGRIAPIYTDETDAKTDDVTTRILWLKGLETGINSGKNDKGQLVDSYKRYIYIHGTPEEGLLGKPASHGCVRMVNTEVVSLYELVAVGTLVLIGD